MRYGVIYIAHNPRDGKTVFKVGKTERSAAERMAELTADSSQTRNRQDLYADEIKRIPLIGGAGRALA